MSKELRQKKEIPPDSLVRKTEEKVATAAKEAARSIGRGLRRAILVAAEYAVHLHKDDKVPRERAIQVGARAVLRTVKREK
jgi:hypothetical protein